MSSRWLLLPPPSPSLWICQRRQNGKTPFSWLTDNHKLLTQVTVWFRRSCPHLINKSSFVSQDCPASDSASHSCHVLAVLLKSPPLGPVAPCTETATTDLLWMFVPALPLSTPWPWARHFLGRLFPQLHHVINVFHSLGTGATSCACLLFQI